MTRAPRETLRVIPSVAEEPDDGVEGQTQLTSYVRKPSSPIPHLVRIAGVGLGRSLKLEGTETIIGRSHNCHLQIDELGVSRSHAMIRKVDEGQFVLEDLGSSNGTLLNGERVVAATRLREGDKIQIGAHTVLRFALFDAIDTDFHEAVGTAISMSESQVTHVGLQKIEERPAEPWAPDSWRAKKVAQAVAYDDADHLARVVARLRRMPPLVTSWEIDELKRQIAEAQVGHRFLLQGGDCAETLADCEPTVITNKLKILMQMSLVLIRGARRPVVRVGRFAGQYAKPRSKMTEVRDGVELPSYLGDLVNRPEFTPESRRPDPELLLAGYHHSAVTLNFIRGLCDGGFADLRRPEYFDIAYFEHADLPASLKLDYNRVAQEFSEGLQFLRAVRDGSTLNDLMQVRFFTSHEGLNLNYESAQTRRVPRQEGFYDLTTHLPWIGERTRALDGAHVDFFRGITNPVGVKVGPSADPAEIVDLVRTLNPTDEPGKVVLITRLGVGNVEQALPRLIEAITRANRRVLWVSDPMHGNGMVTPAGVKTRNFDDILGELERTMNVHESLCTVFGGVHFELTGEDVTECMGGGLAESDLSRNYATVCDPRLNYRQAIQMAFCLAERLKVGPRLPSERPPPPSASSPRFR